MFKVCNHERKGVQAMQNGMHYAKEMCMDCGKWIKWIPNPNTPPSKRKQTSDFSIEEVLVFRKQDKRMCFFCGRSNLSGRETFTIDHIVELQDGGLDCIENLQILCSACHQQKNWMRTYLNKHQNELMGV